MAHPHHDAIRSVPPIHSFTVDRLNTISENAHRYMIDDTSSHRIMCTEVRTNRCRTVFRFKIGEGMFGLSILFEVKIVIDSSKTSTSISVSTPDGRYRYYHSNSLVWYTPNATLDSFDWLLVRFRSESVGLTMQKNRIPVPVVVPIRSRKEYHEAGEMCLWLLYGNRT